MFNNPSSEMTDISYKDMQSKEFKDRKIPKMLEKYMQMDNIAPELDEDKLDHISGNVIAGYNIDDQSRSQWTNKMKKAFNLVDGKLESKNNPWPNAANIKYPLITSACIQFNSRINPEVIRDDRVVEVRYTGSDVGLSTDTGQTAGAEPQSPIMGLPGAIPGAPVGSSPAAPIPGEPMLGAPMPQGPQMAPYGNSDRAQRLSQHMSYQLLGQSTHWSSDTDKLLMMLPMTGLVYRKSFFNPIDGHPDTEVCSPEDVVVNNNIKSIESAQRITHVQTMTSNQLLEYMRAGIFTEYPLEELASSPEEKKDLSTDSSMNYQTTEEDEILKRNHTILEQHTFLDLDGDNYGEPYIITTHETSGKVLRIVARYDIDSFEFNSKGKLIKIKPINYFTDYHFILNPDGSFHSFGFGVLLYMTNETINSIMNQLLDAGVLANRQGGFLGKGLRLPKGDYEFRPGEFRQVIVPPGASIGDMVYPLPIKEPSPTLFQLLSFLIESAKPITSISDVMEGEAPAANTPAATTLALVEQGQKVFSAILKRIYDSLKKEFTKLYEINRKYLADEESFPLAVGTGMVTVADYKLPNYGIYPVADPNLSSQTQRLMQAQALMQLIGNPMVNERAILKNYLEVLKVPNIEEILPEPDPNAPPPVQEQLQKAELKLANLQPALEIMDRELESLKIGIDEAKQKSQTAYYGGRLATEKVDSAIKIAEANAELGPQAVDTALQEEEQITQETQIQDIPIDVYQRLSQLEGQIDQMFGQQGQQPQVGPEAMDQGGQPIDISQLQQPEQQEQGGLQPDMPTEGEGL